LFFGCCVIASIVLYGVLGLCRFIPFMELDEA
jgi:hypothetical protein